MSTLMSLPAELVCYIGSYLLMPDLGHYAMSRRFISACCTKRVKRHNDVLQFAKQRTWTGWKTDGQDPSRYTVSAPDWLDFLIALLEKKELSWYVESISFDCVESPTWENERTKLKAQLGTREKNIIRDALIKMPWFKQQDPTFVALWIETDPSLRFRPFSNIKLPRRWLFLVMILFMLENMTALEVVGNRWRRKGADKDLLKTLTCVVNDAVKAPASSPWPMLRSVKGFKGPHAIILPLLALPSVEEVFLAYEKHSFDSCCLELAGWPKRLPDSPAKSAFIVFDKDQDEEDAVMRFAYRVAYNMRGPCLVKLVYAGDYAEPSPVRHINLQRLSHSG